MADGEKQEISGMLHPSSFGGVPFFVRSVRMVGGRKATRRRIINSDEQLISDVGREQPSYEVNGYVTATYGFKLLSSDKGIKKDYIETRDSLLEVLRSPGAKTFVHPWEGPINKLVCVKHSLNETMNEAGVGQLTLTLEVETGATVAKQPEDKGAATLLQVTEYASESFLEYLGLYALEAFLESVVGAYEAALETMTAVFAKVKIVADAVENVAATITGFAQDINDAIENVSAILLTPLAVIDSIRNVYISLKNIFPTFEARFDAMVKGFDFGDSIGGFSQDTGGGRAKQQTQDIIVANTKGLYLMEAYNAAAGLGLTTLDEIERVDEILDAQHTLLMANPTIAGDTKDAMMVVRETFNALLSARRLTALKTVESNMNFATTRTLAYQLYGDDANAVTLAEINEVEKFECLKGATKVLAL